MEAVIEAWDDAIEEGANKIASAGTSATAAGPSTAPSDQTTMLLDLRSRLVAKRQLLDLLLHLLLQPLTTKTTL